MIAFHIDMNVAQFTRAYLEKWLKELAKQGYNTIIWEVEDNIAWETCPQCVSPDAFSKDEFRELLAMSRGLGLEPIPLLQTIGHCEYVLKHEQYKHLAEANDYIAQYCPRKGELIPFLTKWIEEYLDVFGDVRHFHLGADEAYRLGSCDACREYVDEHSLSQLFIDHINNLSKPLLDRNITPIIWADMILHHNEALDLLSRDIMLFDWQYDRYHGSGRIHIWGEESHKQAKHELSKKTLRKFGKYLFPHGDEDGREPETFYTADFLADNGFQVVTCPTSSCCMDTVFAPRNWLHMVNTFDSFRKGMDEHMGGSVLTSWTVHLFPWELQLACIDIPGFLHRHEDAPIEAFQEAFVTERFGTTDATFWRACGLLSKNILFTFVQTLGHDKCMLPVPLQYAADMVKKLADEGRLDEELTNCRERLAEYRQSPDLFEAFAAKASKGQEILDWWKLAGRNLINRAEAAIFLLQKAKGQSPQDGREILDNLRSLRKETEEAYSTIIKPTRRKQIIGWIYASVENALAEIVDS
jgi:hypothetical protein